MVTQSLQRREGAQRGAESVGFLMEKGDKNWGASRGVGETGVQNGGVVMVRSEKSMETRKEKNGFPSGSERETRRSTGIGRWGMTAQRPRPKTCRAELPWHLRSSLTASSFHNSTNITITW